MGTDPSTCTLQLVQCHVRHGHERFICPTLQEFLKASASWSRLEGRGYWDLLGFAPIPQYIENLTSTRVGRTCLWAPPTGLVAYQTVTEFCPVDGHALREVWLPLIPYELPTILRGGPSVNECERMQAEQAAEIEEPQTTPSAHKVLEY